MDVKKRIKRLQRFLEEQKIDAIIIDNPLNLFYLTEQEVSAGILLVSQTKARLLVDNRYFEVCKKKSPLPVSLLKEKALEKLLLSKSCEAVSTLAFDSDATSYQKALKLMEIAQKISSSKRKAGRLELIPLDHPIKTLRSIKDEDEIRALKKAAELGSEGYDFVCSLLKPGITEIEVATELEIFWKRKGSKGLAFESIIAFGANSSMPHYKAGRIKLKKNQPVLIDIGVNYGHYHSDMTRVPFVGEPSAKLREIYAVVLQAQEEALKLCLPGTKISTLDAAARAVIDSHGYKHHFTHSLGHGIGLEIHELPFIKGTSDEELQPGMVITIEPGIYLPDIGGIRIEDTVVITHSGHLNLTNRPKDILIL